MGYQPDAETTQHSQEADINDTRRIRTHNRSKRKVADPRLRQRSHFDQPYARYCLKQEVTITRSS